MSGVIPETRYSVSPARLHHQCELIADWIGDELTRTAIALIPDWGELARRTRRIRRATAHATGRRIDHRSRPLEMNPRGSPVVPQQRLVIFLVAFAGRCEPD
jgi:hypothetical protein